MATALALFALGFSGRAWADPAAAEALFREGHRLLEEGRYEQAAEKLAESQAQDPASGTLINLALAYEKWGRLATAWATYQDAALLARRDGRTDRVATAERKHQELEPRVPKLTFTAEAPAEGLVVTWGRVRIGVGALGSPIPIDPGDYHLSASAPGRKAWDMELHVSEGQRATITIPELASVETTDKSAAPIETPVPAAQPPLKQPAQPLSVPAPQPARATVSAWPIALGASGLVLVAAGSWFGVRALSQYHQAENACPSHRGCTDGALDDWRSARTSAWVSNIGVGAGLAACAVSAWLFFGTRKANDVSVGVSPANSGATLSVRARL